jgi:O-antigen/teichoic acid export membrane protein
MVKVGVASLLRDSAVTILSRGIVLLMALGASILLARGLGPTLKGSYSLIVLITQMTSLLVLFGLGSANVYLGAREPKQLPTLAGNSVCAALILGMGGALVTTGLTMVPRIVEYLSNNGVEAAWVRWIVWVLPLVLMNAYLQEILRAAGDITRYNFVAIVSALLLLTGFVSTLWIWPMGLAGAVGSWVGTHVLVAGLVTYWVLRLTRGRLRVDMAYLRRSFGFGVRLYLGNVAQFLNYRLDLFLVAYFLGPLAVGLYATASALAERLWEIPHALRTVLLHRIAGAQSQQDAQRVTTLLSRLTFAFAGVLCVGLAATSEVVIEGLYGKEFLGAAAALVALMPGVWAMSVGKLLAVHLAGSGKPEVGTYGALLALSMTLVLDLLLIPRLGIVGASVASSVSYMLATAFLTVVFLGTTRLRLQDILFLRRRDMTTLQRRLTAAVAVRRVA